MDWKNCDHKWDSVPKHSAFGLVHQDECTKCGSIGVLSKVPNEQGFFQIVAQPWATIISLDEYRKRKVKQDEQETSKSASK